MFRLTGTETKNKYASNTAELEYMKCESELILYRYCGALYTFLGILLSQYYFDCPRVE